MGQNFSVSMSNRTELLFEELKEGVYRHANPFARRIVIVPSAAMKSWLTLRMAQDPALRIAAGLEVGYVEPSLKKIYSLFTTNSSEKGCEPTEMELAFALESEISAIATGQGAIPIQEALEWRPLLRYLGASDGHLKPRAAKRIGALAAKLAKMFLDYGLYGGKMLPKFLNEGGWQSLLWQRMEKIFQRWNYPYRKLINTFIQSPFLPADLQIHLFGLSYVAPIHHQFLLEISAHVPVTYYILSPCQKFWSDLVSDKERWQLRKFWDQKGANDGQQERLDDFLRDNNPLLANFGRLGREMALQLEEGMPQVEARYVVPQAAAVEPAYADLLDPDLEFVSDRELSVLEAVQSDITLLRNPDEGEKIRLKPDSTIQIHAAPKPRREVEVVYDLILSILDKHSQDAEPIMPSDVVVMASNLALYEPYIRAVFEAGEAPLNIQLMDVAIPSQNTFIQAFLHLIALAFSRWENVALIRLFDFTAFQKRHRIKTEEAAKIVEWIKEAKIAWGSDGSHREELLKRDHCVRGAIGGGVQGTWEQGLGELTDRLIRKTAVQTKAIDPLQGELLGKVVRILRELQSDLKPLTDSTMLSLGDWVSYLTCLCEGYLNPIGEEEGIDGHRLLLEHLNGIKRAEAKLKDRKFPFHTIRRQLEKSLRAQTSTYRESNLNAIRFCSLLPMRAVPAKVIVLMGMGDGQFPRQEDDLSINALLKFPEADYFPSQVDFDRYLFFEALLSARRYFALTYTSRSPGESEELLPSLLVSELLDYLDRAYQAPGMASFSHHHLHKHPMKSFHFDYFVAESRFRSYSVSKYKAALAYYNPQKKARQPFLPIFNKHASTDRNEAESLIYLTELSAFAKNPLKTFLNKYLDIYVKSPEERVLKEEEAMLMSKIDSSKWTKMGIHSTVGEMLNQAKNSEKFPSGPFTEVELQKLEMGIQELKGKLAACNIHEEDPFTIEFSERHLVPHQKNNGWKVPPLEIGGIKLVGKISAASTNGIIFHDKNDNLYRYWPEWLAFACLIKKYNLPFKSDAFFTKEDKFVQQVMPAADVESALGEFIAYYLSGLSAPSPLVSDVIKPLLAGDFTKAQELLLKENSFSPTYDQHLAWFKRVSAGADFKENLAEWQAEAKRLYCK